MSFWDKEYTRSSHLTLSGEPAEDLIHFARWAERNSEWYPFPKGGTVLDLGVGNGRNLIWLCRQAGMKGVGYELSQVAIDEAKKSAGALPINFERRSIAGPLALEDQSVDVVFDMMTSHFLNQAERKLLIEEVVRVLKPYGWFFMKTFVMEGDMHVKRLIKEYPGKEPQTYIHPKIKVAEFVWTEEQIRQAFSAYFTIHKMIKSYKHVTKEGKPHKRRTISIYMEKKGEQA